MKNDSDPGGYQFCVTVDTEEEGLWGSAYRISGNTTENLRALPRFQALCESFEVPPTYLIDAPVLDDPRAISDLSTWQRAGTCEVGTHCHPWCNPPLDDRPPTSAETYLCNLPAEVQFDKLSWLTDRIADTFGTRPTSYRAGRYGFDDSSAEILQELNYVVDSSVLPLHDYRRHGGPDFSAASRFPYRLMGDDRGLIEIPIAVGFTQRGGYGLRRSMWTGLRKKPWSHARLAGIADRLGVARRVKLSPEGTRLADLKRMVDVCVADGMRTFVLMLHSTSLVAGVSPYARDEEGLERLYDRLAGILGYLRETHHMQGVTLTGAAKGFIPESLRLLRNRGG